MELRTWAFILPPLLAAFLATAEPGIRRVGIEVAMGNYAQPGASPSAARRDTFFPALFVVRDGQVSKQPMRGSDVSAAQLTEAVARHLGTTTRDNDVSLLDWLQAIQAQLPEDAGALAQMDGLVLLTVSPGATTPSGIPLPCDPCRAWEQALEELDKVPGLGTILVIGLTPAL